jgi:hypothetical protein
MAKRKALGAEAEAIARGTPAQAVSVATQRKPNLRAVDGDAEKKDLVTLNIRIPPEQMFAIQNEAMRRYQEKGGGGRLNLSEVAQDIIREWMAKR